MNRSASFNFRGTNSNDEDAGGPAGWSLADAAGSDSDSSWSGDGRAPRLRTNAPAATKPVPAPPPTDETAVGNLLQGMDGAAAELAGAPGRNTGARGGMLNGRACRRARQRIAARQGLAYARIALASGQPPETNNGGSRKEP